VIVGFVDIGEIIDHHCLNFLYVRGDRSCCWYSSNELKLSKVRLHCAFDVCPTNWTFAHGRCAINTTDYISTR